MTKVTYPDGYTAEIEDIVEEYRCNVAWGEAAGKRGDEEEEDCFLDMCDILWYAMTPEQRIEASE